MNFIIIVRIGCSIENFERLEEARFISIFNGYRQMIVSNDIERGIKIVFQLEKNQFWCQLKIESIEEIEQINEKSDQIVIDRLTT